jgi:hypothetical protein
MARFELARHIFVCRDEDYVVVLDLRQDRYFALEAAKTAALSLALPGWPVSAPAGPVSEDRISAVAEPLLKQGWLLESPGAGKHALPVQAPRPEMTLSELEAGADGKLGVATVYAFVMASVFAKFALRFWRFERVVQRVASRNATHRDPARPFDLQRARELMSAFARLRVFLFSTRDECLHDSLAVLEFLARHDLFPSWVFAVRARPFAAHCWVQHAEVVCNDTVEHVGGYIPIMVV